MGTTKGIRSVASGLQGEDLRVLSPTSLTDLIHITEGRFSLATLLTTVLDSTTKVVDKHCPKVFCEGDLSVHDLISALPRRPASLLCALLRQQTRQIQIPHTADQVNG